MTTFSVIVAVIFTLAITIQAGHERQSIHPELLTIIISCKTETGASDADMEALIKHLPAVTMEGKCNKACLFQKLSLMGTDGRIRKDVALRLMSGHLHGDVAKLRIAEEILNACNNIPISSNMCEAAEQNGACMIAEAQKRGISSHEL